MSGKKQFFEALGREQIVYDEVLIIPQYSEIRPDQANLQTRFSRNVPLNIPIVSAAMDTVTERKMAIAMALLGGLGVIHRNLDPETQAKEVALTKSYLNAKIAEPVCVDESMSVHQVLTMCKEHGYTFQSFPVLNRAGQIAGILTRNDIDLCDSPTDIVKDVMTKEVVTAPPTTTLLDAKNLMHARKKKVLPLVDSDRIVRGMYVYSDIKRVVSGDSNGANIDNNGHLRVGAAVGTSQQDVERVYLLAKSKVDVIVIDTAHGDSRAVHVILETIKRDLPQLDVVAGNISTETAVEPLIAREVDGIKVGQGPGSICSTQIISGAGRSQLSAVYYCATEASKAGIPVCADGGIRHSGDITKAIVAGASSVMIGNKLAGCEESPGERTHRNGKPYKVYRGMGSLGAMQDNSASRQRYGQGDVAVHKLVPEGVEGVVAYTGLAEQTIFQFLGGLRSGMGYTGAATIQELQEKGDFHRLSPLARIESHPHDIEITKDAPNYRR